MPAVFIVLSSICVFKQKVRQVLFGTRNGKNQLNAVNLRQSVCLGKEWFQFCNRSVGDSHQTVDKKIFDIGIACHKSVNEASKAIKTRNRIILRINTPDVEIYVDGASLFLRNEH